MINMLVYKNRRSITFLHIEYSEDNQLLLKSFQCYAMVIAQESALKGL